MGELIKLPNITAKLEAQLTDVGNTTLFMDHRCLCMLDGIAYKPVDQEG